MAKFPETEAVPVPEPEDETALRIASNVRRRRARGGRAQTILNNARAPNDPTQPQAAGARAPGAFTSGIGGGRGRTALINA